jgi:hypothetical protein
MTFMFVTDALESPFRRVRTGRLEKFHPHIVLVRIGRGARSFGPIGS